MSAPSARGVRVAVGAVVLDARAARQLDVGPKVLLVRRANPPLEGEWSLPGGKVEHGETLAQAVAREVLEETGVSVRVGRLLEVVELIDGASHFVVLDYLCEPTSFTPRAGDDARDVAWVGAYDLAEYRVTPAVARVVSKALSGDERE